MNVLVLAPHPDDEVLGCGGTVRQHVLDGDRVEAVFLTSGELGGGQLPPAATGPVREQEAAAAASVLGLDAFTFLRLPDWMLEDHVAAAEAELGAVLGSRPPDLIYLPHEGESHPDHRVSMRLCRGALALTPDLDPELRCYEFWSPLTEWSLLQDITGTMAEKLAALRCYPSQTAQIDYERAVIGLNQYRGALARPPSRYAEAFHRPG